MISYFMNGTEVEGQRGCQSTEESIFRKPQPIVAKPLKEIILEAGLEQKIENLRRKENLIFPRAPESEATESADHMNDNLKLLNDL